MHIIVIDKTIHIRWGVIFCLLVLIFVQGCAENADAIETGEERPNILVIYTDDQRSDAVGYSGNDLIRTPNIDEIAEGGTHFTNAFVTLSVCSPSRAALLTGRYGSANGVLQFGNRDNVAKLNEGETTIAHYLKRAGYQTGHIGKWHLEDPPDSAGFDFVSYFVSNGPFYGRTVIEEGERKTAQGFIEDYSAEKAVQYLEEASRSEAPFLLALNTQIPHMNHEFDWPASDSALSLYDEDEMPVPETWQDDLSGKPSYLKSARNRERAQDMYGYDEEQGIRRHMKRYYAAITDMDTAIGRVLDSLTRLNLDGNTYIFFMSDNGWFIGDHGFTSKVLPYEESIRVPFAVNGPDIEAKVDSHIVLNIDIAPTLMEMAGLSVPENMHGRSLMPLLHGEEVDWRDSFYYEAPEPQLGSWPLLAVRTHRWKYIQTLDKDNPSNIVFEELYDLRSDPNEMINLADDTAYADTADVMQAKIRHHQQEINSE